MLRSTTPRDDRRRRALSDVASVSAVPPVARKGATPRPADAYTAAARRENQLGWIDLVPHRHRGLAAWLGIGAGIIGTEIWLFAASRTWAIEGAIDAFSLTSRQSLAAWTGSLILALATGLSLLIYSLRRNKLDDYRGRYRVWLSAAATWLVLSLNAAAPTQEPLRAALAEATGRVGWRDGALWWMIPAGVWMGLLIVRLGLETRACRTACGAVAGASGCWIAALLIEYIPVPVSEFQFELLVGGLRLAGYWLLWFGLLAFARHVVLDANGELAPRRGRTRRRHSPPAADEPEVDGPAVEEGETRSRVDPPHVPASSAATPLEEVKPLSRPPVAPSTRGQPAPPLPQRGGSETSLASQASKPAPVVRSAPAAVAVATSRTANSPVQDRDESDPQDRKLSRAERKKLRRSRDRLDD